MALAMFLACLATPAAASVATAVKVVAGAKLVSGHETRTLTKGMTLEEGDEIRTDRTGEVQLIFSDDTRIAIAANSTFKVNAVVMSGRNSASKFAVTAIGGSIRFITGKSSKPAYEIKTPTATMGVRGTVFDVAVTRNRRTELVLHEGSVRMCGVGRFCATVNGSCTMVRASGTGRISVPESDEDAARSIAGYFPYVKSQETLVPKLRVKDRGCDRYLAALKELETAVEVKRNSTILMQETVPEYTPPPPSPPAPPPPAPPPAPEPPKSEPPTPPAPQPPSNPSYPGQSGDSGPSQGSGSPTSSGQHGTGTGKGQGADHTNRPDHSGGGGSTNGGGGGSTGGGGGSAGGGSSNGGGHGVDKKGPKDSKARGPKDGVGKGKSGGGKP